MATISLTIPDALLPRVVAALAKMPNKQGARLPADATNAQRNAHAKEVLAAMVKQAVLAVEAGNPDADLDAIG